MSRLKLGMSATSIGLYDSLVRRLSEMKAITIAAQLAPDLERSHVEATIRTGELSASVDMLNAAVVAAKQSLIKAALGRYDSVVMGKTRHAGNNELHRIISRLSTLGLYVFVGIIPDPDRREDMTFYWSKPTTDGELAASACQDTFQALLLIDAEISKEWADTVGDSMLSFALQRTDS